MTDNTYTECDCNGNKLVFYTPNDFLVSRADGLYTSEPETIAWINLMSKDDVLWDIGANIGTYSLYAALAKGMQVVAFEPESSNFSILNKNIRTNECEERIQAYPIAIGNAGLLTTLYLARDLPGWACNTIGKNYDAFLRPRTTSIPQGAVCLSLDNVSQELATTPTHIKIDVDGLELDVIKSGLKVFQNTSLKSVLVELNLDIEEHYEAKCLLESYGYHLNEELSKMTIVKSGAFKGLNNLIFHRDKESLNDIINSIKK